MKKLNRILVLAFPLLFLFGCGESYKEPSFEEIMREPTKSLNKNCPTMVDKETTRFDGGEVLPNKVFQYNYTIVNSDRSELNVEGLKRDVTEVLEKDILDSNTLILRDNKATIQYKYNDKNGHTLFVISFAPDQYSIDSSAVIGLTTKTFFDCLTLDLPNNLTHTSQLGDEKMFDIVGYKNLKDGVSVSIRKVKEKDLNDIKALHETMGTSFYKGKVKTSEFRTINGKEVLVFQMRGYWNGEKEETEWIKCFSISKNSMYQFLIQYPVNYKKYSDDLLNRVVSSIKVCD